MVGFITLLVTVLLSVYFLALWFVNDESIPDGFTTLVLLVLWSISLNSMFLGIFGEYLSRIYARSALKRMTIVEESING